MLDAQKRGKAEMLFGNPWHNMIPQGLGVNEVVLEEQVVWEEGSCGQHLCV